ncbi:hypothetical protein SLS53_005196 [Cytospora paraplurivora]|uniref:Rhodopsin domain-containing protein n=1 Tax=Cytospora paraplurivora TaxID=2898453 RepID=A0AAN9UEE7_9PEZI
MNSTVTGAIPAPKGFTPNFEHPADVLHTINYVTQALSLVIVTGFIVVKHYSKVTVLRGTWQLEDFTNHGGGYNQWEVKSTEIVTFYKTGYAATIFYAPMAFTVKLALLLIIARVFGPVHKKTIFGIWVFMGLLAGYYFSALVVKIRICWPISAYWEGDATKCLDQSAIITADAIVSAVSDLVILLMPTPLTWSLQLPLRKKLRVTGILCAGGVATAFSVYRLGMILTEGSSTNQTIVFVKVILSGNAEVGIGLICTCLPAITAMYTRRKGATGYNTGEYGYGTGNKSARSRNLNGDNTMSSKNQIYVNHTIQMDTCPRDEEDAIPGDPDQFSQDQIELVTHAQGVGWTKGI